MLQGPVVPFGGAGGASDALLVVACKLFRDRIAALDDIVAQMDRTERDPARQAAYADAEARADNLLSEAMDIGWAITVTPAHHPTGHKAKVEAFQAYADHFGIPDHCLAFDLARSIIGDLLHPDHLKKLANQAQARYGEGAQNS